MGTFLQDEGSTKIAESRFIAGLLFIMCESVICCNLFEARVGMNIIPGPWRLWSELTWSG